VLDTVDAALYQLEQAAYVAQVCDGPADMTSLDFLKAVYRNAALPLSTRMRAAIAALPFEHPKLAVTAQIDVDGDFAERLEQAILRSEMAMKIIEHEPKARLSQS